MKSIENTSDQYECKKQNDIYIYIYIYIILSDLGIST